jgi:hypothetical protein
MEFKKVTSFKEIYERSPPPKKLQSYFVRANPKPSISYTKKDFDNFVDNYFLKPIQSRGYQVHPNLPFVFGSEKWD